MGSPRTRLVLHFDVNETIMVGDPAGGDTFEDSLNKVIAKSAVVRRMPEANGTESRWPTWCWHDGTPLDPEVRAAQGLAEPPPLLEDFEFSQQPAGCTSFYKVGELRQFAKEFTSHVNSPGVIYKGLYERLERCLRCDPKMDNRLCHDGCHHFLLPAFFNTLTALRDAGRSYSVIIRTFGTDGSKVVSAIQAFSEGAHSHYAAVPELGESIRDSPLWRGKYVQEEEADSEKFVLEADGESVSDELMVEETLVKPKERISACCCQDDYFWWRVSGSIALAQAYHREDFTCYQHAKCQPGDPCLSATGSRLQAWRR